jgi:hypothetical protein
LRNLGETVSDAEEEEEDDSHEIEDDGTEGGE